MSAASVSTTEGPGFNVEVLELKGALHRGGERERERDRERERERERKRERGFIDNQEVTERERSFIDDQEAEMVTL